MADLLDAFAVLAVAYPRDYGRYTDEQTELWESMLKDADPVALLAACKRLAGSSKWAPTVAEIREAAGCVDPDTAARRAASAEAAAKHDAWVAEQDRIALQRARENLQRNGIDPDNIKPVAISELLKGIGR